MPTTNKTDIYTKETDTRFTLRIDTELLDKVKAQALIAKRSTAKQIEFMLEEYLSNTSTKSK